MKRIILLVLAVIMIMSLCACETPQEKANREIQEANEAYRDAQRELGSLESELEEIQRKINQSKGN